MGSWKRLFYIPAAITCAHAHVKSFQSWVTLCDPVDCNPPGSSGHGILQARIPQGGVGGGGGVAMPPFRGSSPVYRVISCYWLAFFHFSLNNPFQCEKITFSGLIGKAMVFLVVMYGCELDHKEGWAPKTWCFWIMVLEKTLKSP